eukprot:806659-Rhodomonas_salina.1
MPCTDPRAASAATRAGFKPAQFEPAEVCNKLGVFYRGPQPTNHIVLTNTVQPEQYYGVWQCNKCTKRSPRVVPVK